MFQSTDDTIRDAVRRHLGWATEVNGERIGVATHEGVVTLRGYVETLPEAEAAERVARAVCGVSGVVNELEVWPLAEHRSVL